MEEVAGPLDEESARILSSTAPNSPVRNVASCSASVAWFCSVGWRTCAQLVDVAAACRKLGSPRMCVDADACISRHGLHMFFLGWDADDGWGQRGRGIDLSQGHPGRRTPYVCCEGQKARNLGPSKLCATVWMENSDLYVAVQTTRSVTQHVSTSVAEDLQ